MKYDICVVTFSDLRYDARSKNLVQMLVSLGYSIVVFSITDYALSGTTHRFVSLPQNRRHIVRWLTFTSAVRSEISEIVFDTYYAADLYSLPAISAVKRKCNIVYDAREIYSELSTLHNSKFRQYILSAIEKHYIKRISKLVTSGKLDSAHLKGKYALNIPIYEVYNYPPNRDYVATNKIREHWNIPNNKYILVYQGVLLQGRGIVPAMRALQLTEQFVLAIFGDGEYRADLERIAKELEVSDRVYFTGNIAYDELHEWTCSGDVGLCNIEPISRSYYFALPNKLFEYMLAELPVVATDLPALAEVVNATKCGEVIPQDNAPDAILVALGKIIADIATYKANAKQANPQFTYEGQRDIISEITYLNLPT
ncbi:MAG: glycosyltransferase [Ignavibacteria bacterium]|jgi:glycosyltransferase involved in cell wall biosynthesis|nr:glycosyltransferase [Ignavibacteria bacterium]